MKSQEAVQSAPPAGEAPPQDVVLSVRNLRTQFSTKGGVVSAVRDVSFDVRRAEKVGIVGESGCGKSALALSVLKLIEPPGRTVGGSVWLNGRAISSLGEKEMCSVRGKEISLIFQDPMTALNPVKRIGDQITEMILRHQKGVKKREARSRAADLLREVEVPQAKRRLDDYPHQYSGGMRQRVMIALALANEPDVIIADEPTTALDVTTQAQVLDLLDRLVSQHRAAILLITHNLGIVAEFCERVLVMYAGRIVERSVTVDAFGLSLHPYTQALLESVPRPDRLQRGPLATIPGLPPNLARLGGGCSFEPRCPLGHGRDICREEDPQPITVGPPEKPIVSECHFARERYEQAAGTRQGAR
jgi:oligopeptide/dipeptide ABC transporter ATP-binding protein